jgi:hypothetical protein
MRHYPITDGLLINFNSALLLKGARRINWTA